MKIGVLNLLIVILAMSLFLTGCTSPSDDGVGSTEPVNVGDWRTFELIDIDGNSIIISEFDKPAFVETFATWCASCIRQQENMAKLHEELGDSFISVGIDIDPNERIADVEDFVEKHGFTSQYVVPPIEYIHALVDEYGPAIASAPTVPVLFVCKGEIELLERGVKDVERLRELVEAC